MFYDTNFLGLENTTNQIQLSTLNTMHVIKYVLFENILYKTLLMNNRRGELSIQCLDADIVQIRQQFVSFLIQVLLTDCPLAHQMKPQNYFISILENGLFS